MLFKNLLLSILLCGVFNYTYGQQLRSVFFDPNGAPDDGREYIEIIGTPGSTISDLWFIQIEGDASNQGIIRTAVNLNGYNIGSNGLLLIRDAVTTILPGPEPGTNVVVFNFTPDLDNGSATFLLVSGFTGNVGDDLDTNNDGTLDILPWTSVTNAIGIKDGAPSDLSYGVQLGGVDISALYDPNSGTFIVPNIFLLYNNVYYGVAASGSGLGPYTVGTAWDASGNPDPGGNLASTSLTPGRIGSTLPVSFISFQGRQNNQGVSLQFRTGIEEEIIRFEIMRSFDGRNFETIGQVSPKGPNASYSFDDRNVTGNRLFYRIRAVELNGVNKYSPVLKINAAHPNKAEVFPNPVQEKANILVSTATGGTATIHINTAGGELVFTSTVNAMPGSNIYMLNTDHLKPGIYLLRIITPDKSVHQSKLIKQ